MSKILILVASQAKNMDLAKALAAEVESQGNEAEIISLVDLHLPLYPDQSINAEEAKQKILDLTNKMFNSNGFIAVAPEYNGGIPPSLSNAIAWISTSTENWRDAFDDKPVALATHSGGGGSQVLLAMRGQFSYVGCDVIGRQILTHYKKPLNPESATAVVKQLIKYTLA